MQSGFVSIYGLADPRNENTQLIFYVGMSADPHKRYRQHLLALDPNKEKRQTISDIKKDGLLPLLVIFEEGVPCENASARERYWIENCLSLRMPLANICKILPSKHKSKRPRQRSIEVVTIDISDTDEYISITRAARELKVKCCSIDYYLRFFAMKKYKYLFDKKRYLKMSDFEQIKTLKGQADRRREAEGSAA